MKFAKTMKTIDEESIKKLNIMKIVKIILSLAVTVLFLILVVTFLIQSIAGYYQIAVNRGMTVFDLTIISTFVGAMSGIVISKFSSIYKSIFNFLNRKKGK